MNDFRFTKSIMGNEKTTTNSKLVQMNDIDRIQRIHDNMGSMFNVNKEKKPVEVIKQNNNDIFKNRIDAINNIKKD